MSVAFANRGVSMKVPAVVVAGLLSFPFSHASAQSVNERKSRRSS
jgi:hypothetical protein